MVLDLSGNFCNYRGNIYKITNSSDICEACNNDDITKIFTNCLKCNGKIKSFVNLQNIQTSLKNINVNEIKIIENYTLPINKYNRDEIIKVEKVCNGVNFTHTYLIVNFTICYDDINYVLEDMYTKHRITMTENEINLICCDSTK